MRIRRRLRRRSPALRTAVAVTGAALLSTGVAAVALAAPSHEAVPAARLVHTAAASHPADPARSRPPGPDFLRYCRPTASGRYRSTAWRCDSYALYNIDQARKSEGLGPLRIPSDYRSLPDDRLMAVIANAERASRHLAPLQESTVLDATATGAAADLTDPVGPAGSSWASVWSGGYRTPLAADYAWMYDDGPGGTNLDCPSSGGGGCWSHRNAILSSFGGRSGGGRAFVDGIWSYTQLFVAS